MSTQTSQPYFIKRHPVAVTIATLVLACTLWIGHFLANFNLNDYRDQLQASLANQLSLPVALGDARLRMKDLGIAVRINAIQIGDDRTPLALSAESLWIELAWHKLLLRQLHFSEIGLIRPDIRLGLASDDTPDGDASRPATPVLVDIGLLNQTFIRTLEIDDGTVQLHLARREGKARVLELKSLHGTIDQLGLGERCQLDLGMTLPQQADEATFRFDGEVTLPTRLDLWREADVDLHFEVNSLRPDQVEALLRPTGQAPVSAGAIDLHTRVSGRLDRTLAFRAELDDGALELNLPDLSTAPITTDHFQFSGLYSHVDETHRLDDLILQINAIRLSGDSVIVQTPEQLTAQFNLGSSHLPLAELTQLKPPAGSPLAVFAASLQAQGELWLNRAGLTLHQVAGETAPSLDLTAFQGSLHQVAVELSPGKTLGLTSVDLDYDTAGWQFGNGNGHVGPFRYRVNGTLAPQAHQTPPELALHLQSDITVEDLLPWLTDSVPENLSARGQIPVEVEVSGPLDNLRADLVARLNRLTVDIGDHFSLPADPEGILTVNARVREQTLQVEHARIQHGPITGRLNGTLNWAGTPRIALGASLGLPDIDTARQLSRHTRDLALTGGIELALTWETPLDKLNAPEFGLNLIDIGVPTGEMLGDISGLTGTVHWSGNGLQTGPMRARIGRSPFQFTARLDDLDDPVLQVDASAAALRADDLIFYSDRSMLRDVHGHLEITPDQLRLSPARVRLDGGTQATVRGLIGWTGRPVVDLDITSEFARIDEIVGLWTDLSPAATKQRERHHKPHAPDEEWADIRIQAHAAEGDLYGMAFQQAEGLIVPTPEMLIIHPLDFRVGPGFCNAQVLVDYSVDGPPLLRISGHGEDLDAFEVHNELLKRKGILRGSLRGDFYLQGRAGETFLPTSYGNFSISARNGVLRQFNILSKVFSILNVSQLFALKLPDMNRDGLPFNEAGGEILFDQGAIKTEGLTIKSDAMNLTYVGGYDLVTNRLDLVLAVQPLGTVDKIVSRIPVAGWLLTGEDRALITAYFKATGNPESPVVEVVPAETLSTPVLGFFKRTFGLPAKLVTDPSILWGGRKDE